MFYLDYICIYNHKRIAESSHYQLGLGLGIWGTLASLVAQHIYAMPPFAYLWNDYTASVALYTHHQYIAGFYIRDFSSSNSSSWFIEKIR